MGDFDAIFPITGAEAFLNFATNLAEALKKKLSDIGQRKGLLACNALIREEKEKLAEDVVDVASRLEFSRKRNQAASGLLRGEEFAFLTSVEDAKEFVFLGAKHAAGAAVGKGEIA